MRVDRIIGISRWCWNRDRRGELGILAPKFGTYLIDLIAWWGGTQTSRLLQSTRGGITRLRRFNLGSTHEQTHLTIYLVVCLSSLFINVV